MKKTISLCDFEMTVAVENPEKCEAYQRNMLAEKERFKLMPTLKDEINSR